MENLGLFAVIAASIDIPEDNDYGIVTAQTDRGTLMLSIEKSVLKAMLNQAARSISDYDGQQH